MILRLKYQFWHKNTNNYLDFQEFIEKVTKTAVLVLILELHKNAMGYEYRLSYDSEIISR